MRAAFLAFFFISRSSDVDASGDAPPAPGEDDAGHVVRVCLEELVDADEPGLGVGRGRLERVGGEQEAHGDEHRSHIQ